MVKCPPNGLARGPEAEPAVGPLIAQLKKNRADIAKAKADAGAAAAREADECVVRAIDAFTERVSNAIIDANNGMKASHVEKLLIRDISFLPGSKLVPGSRIEIKCQRILTGIRTWASKNGISIQVTKMDIPKTRPQSGFETCSFNENLQVMWTSLERAIHGRYVRGHPPSDLRSRGHTETVTTFEKRLEKERGGWKFKQITFSWEAELEEEE